VPAALKLRITTRRWQLTTRRSRSAIPFGTKLRWSQPARRDFGLW
jgi:hypothetical protein